MGTACRALPFITIMSDEEREPRLFTLTEAERTRQELEPILLEAMDSRRKMAELDHSLLEVANRIMLMGDRKSTRLNSSHVKISYAVFCLKKKNTNRKLSR